MRILLNFLYTDEYSNAPDARLVLAAADEYGLKRLQMLAAGAYQCVAVREMFLFPRVVDASVQSSWPRNSPTAR